MFSPNKISLPDDLTYEDITEIGILSAVQCLFILNGDCGDSLVRFGITSSSPDFANIFPEATLRRRFDDAIKEIVQFDMLIFQDHGTNLNTFEVKHTATGCGNLQALRNLLLQNLSSKLKNYKLARALIGQYLHVMQMIYMNNTNAFNNPWNTANMLTISSPVDIDGYTASELGDKSAQHLVFEDAVKRAITQTKLFFTALDYGLNAVLGDELMKQILGMEEKGHKSCFVVDEDRVPATVVQKVLTETHHRSSTTVVLVSQSDRKLVYEYLQPNTLLQWERCDDCLMSALQKAYSLLTDQGKLIVVTSEIDQEDNNRSNLTVVIPEMYNTGIRVDAVLYYNRSTSVKINGLRNIRQRRAPTSDPSAMGCSRMNVSTPAGTGNVSISVGGARSKPDVIKPSMNIYTIIADITGGTVYHTDHNHIADVIAVLKESVTTFPPVKILKFTMDRGSRSSFLIPIDTTVTEFNVKVEGTSSFGLSSTHFKLYQPNGTEEKFAGSNTRIRLGLQLVVMKVQNPVPGLWRVTRARPDDWQVDCSAQSPLDFTYALMTPGPTELGMYQIIGRPIACDNATILVKILRNDLVRSVEKVVLLKDSGLELDSYPLRNVGGRRGRSLFRGSLIIPALDFRVAVRGEDQNNNTFQRLSPMLVSTVAIRLEVFPLSGTLYRNESVTIPYRVSNVGARSTTIKVAVSDDLNFARAPTSLQKTIAGHDNFNSTFVLMAGEQTGQTTTVTISAKVVGAPYNRVQFHVQTVTVEERLVKTTDTIPPTCNVTSVHGNCAFGADVCACSTMTWFMEVSAGDVGFGLLDVFPTGTGVNYTFTSDKFTAGHTLDKGIIKARLSDDCCHQLAKINVVDLAGHVDQCEARITPNFTRPNLQLCLPKTAQSKPVNSTKHAVGAVNISCTIITQSKCDLRSTCLMGPVNCSKITWTMKANLSRNGIGQYAAIPVNAGRGAILTYNNYALTLKTDCCHTSAVVRFSDIAGNIGQCDGSPAVQHDIKPLNCTRRISCYVKSVAECDFRKSPCKGHKSACNDTAKDCDDMQWNATAMFGNEGLGNYTVSLVNAGSKPTFNYTNNTVFMRADCCQTSVQIRATDSVNNTGVCVVMARILHDSTTTAATEGFISGRAATSVSLYTPLLPWISVHSKNQHITQSSGAQTPSGGTDNSTTLTTIRQTSSAIFNNSSPNTVPGTLSHLTLQTTSRRSVVPPAVSHTENTPTTSAITESTPYIGSMHQIQAIGGMVFGGLGFLIAIVTACVLCRKDARMKRTVLPLKKRSRAYVNVSDHLSEKENTKPKLPRPSTLSF